MKKDIHSEAVEKLFTAVMSLKNMEECYLFFEDICTVNELLSLSQRFDVGSRLLEKQTYQEISEATGASTATISRVNRLLNDNKNGIEMAAARVSRRK
ncbi:MAG: TrpR YerC/YecD [Stomatobaculum sp.]|nr:TrpR YerC/YecD [Stomatobaculum sp.]